MNAALALLFSYSKDLMDKVTEMAEGIEVEDAPHFTTRDEIMKKVNILGGRIEMLKV